MEFTGRNIYASQTIPLGYMIYELEHNSRMIVVDELETCEKVKGL